MSQSTTVQYLLPGERDASSSSIVHRHGLSSTKFVSPLRIYEPKENDHVIGIVLVRTPDLFLVDINSAEAAILPIPSFDKGCLPSRQAMNRLSTVYARVVRADPWTQTELSCQSTDSSKKKLNYGLINYGNLLRCSLVLCDKLRRSPLINRLHQLIKNFQIRITHNGFVWFSTETNQSMIAVKNLLVQHEVENNIDRLIEHYHILTRKLQEQDENLVQVKQRPPRKIVKDEVTTKNSNNTAVARLMNDVIRSVLDKIIDQIVDNENKPIDQ